MKQSRPNTPFEMPLGNSQFPSYAIPAFFDVSTVSREKFHVSSDDD
ncbi:hypothetical protein PENFLA_c164G02879, partial [Penicillium flavigenum]